MGFLKKVCIIFLFSCVFIGCSTVKYFTPGNYERNDGQIENIYKDSTIIIINDLRKSTDDRTKDVIEEILRSSLNSSENNHNKNLIIRIDIIEHRAYFSYNRWNGETIVQLILSEDNSKILTENIIKMEKSVLNVWGYRSAEEVAQKTFEDAMNEVLNVLKNIAFN